MAKTKQQGNTRTEFFDSRDKYLSFVTATDEKVRIAFYLADELKKTKVPPVTEPFYLLDAGTGEGTVVSTFLAALHKRMPQKPIVVTGKEISIDDICVLLSYLPDRFSEHKPLVFHLTNLTYQSLANPVPEKITHIKYPLKGRTSHDFGLQLMAMSDFVQKHWALNIVDGQLKPKQNVVLTLYRQDQQEWLKPLLALPFRYDFIIASQAFRLRRLPAKVAKSVIAPLLRLLKGGGRMVLVYSSGRDFSKPLLKMLYPDIRPYIYAAPQKLLTALRHLPEMAQIKTRTDELRFGFINLFLGRNEFSLGNIITLWKAVTYVGQVSDAESAAVKLDETLEAKMQKKLTRQKSLSFLNNVIVFTKSDKADKRGG